ncbi:MAG: CRISPR-associated endonuclease Cas2 [Verrucomicrobiales bacterium]|nr:CRISPR-associated endonuclease Cas2 [Verrucomicrobiales bacterium]
MNRTRYLVCYDVSDPKRLRKVAKICESFGSRIQYSVFECPLDQLSCKRLRSQLDEVINHTADQVLFVSLGKEDSKSAFRIESLGLPYTERSRITVI